MAISNNNVAGMTPSTIDFKLATVTIDRGSTSEHQEIIVLGSPLSSLGMADVVAAPPVSTTYGLVVRVASGPSSGVDLLMRPVFSSTNTDNPVRAVLSSTAADNPVQFMPGTAGGCLTFHAVASTSDNATNIKTSAGQVYGIDAFNNGSAPVYLKFHNSTSTPTAGSGVVRTFGVQAGTRGRASFPNGLAFSTGIGITIVVGIADNSTLRVAAATDFVVDVEYR